MAQPPARAAAAETPADVHIMLAAHPTVSFYRYLYNHVGKAWNWSERRYLDYASLAAQIQNPQVQLYVLYLAGVPAGYAELDMRQAQQPAGAQLAYFGLLPEFIGRGLGRYFLRWSVQRAWQQQPQRLRVHSCDLDHPRALGLYQSVGFVLCATRYEQVRTMPVGSSVEN